MCNLELLRSSLNTRVKRSGYIIQELFEKSFTYIIYSCQSILTTRDYDQGSVSLKIWQISFWFDLNIFAINTVRWSLQNFALVMTAVLKQFLTGTKFVVIALPAILLPLNAISIAYSEQKLSVKQSFFSRQFAKLLLREYMINSHV